MRRKRQLELHSGRHLRPERQLEKRKGLQQVAEGLGELAIDVVVKEVRVGDDLPVGAMRSCISNLDRSFDPIGRAEQEVRAEIVAKRVR